MADKTCHEMTQVVREIPINSKHFIVETGYINCAYHNHFVSIGIFQDKQCTIPISASAGRAIIEATDDGIHWGDLYNGEIDLTIPNYYRPNMTGYAASIRANVDGLIPTHDIHSNYFFRLRVHSYM